MKKKKVKKQKTFFELLAEQLSSIGTVEVDDFGDKSAAWIEVKVGDKTLCFSFDYERKKLEDIGLFEDVIEVTDTKQLWTSKPPKAKEEKLKCTAPTFEYC